VLVLAQRAQLCGATRRVFYFSGFASGSCATREDVWRNAQQVLGLSCFVLVAARRAGVTCAACRVALLRLGVFWILRGAQVCTALRAGLGV
ncbi:hypothetical protein A2U01_0058017, partial [Trifolium medium]|nr:hypothetical protein [Trifolium medium]